MSVINTITLPRGEPLAMVQRVESGDPAGLQATCEMRPSTDSGYMKAGAPVVATLECDFVPGFELPAYWTIALSAAASDALSPGSYVLDVRYTLAGVTVKYSSKVVVIVAQRVTD